MNYSIIKTKSAGYAIQCNKTNRIVCHSLTQMQAERVLKTMNVVKPFTQRDNV